MPSTIEIAMNSTTERLDLPQPLSEQVLVADAEIQAAIIDSNGNSRERNARIKAALVKMEAFYVKRIDDWMAGL